MTLLRPILLTSLLSICIGISYTETQTETQTPLSVSADSGHITFTLRHIHATSNTSHILFADVPSSSGHNHNFHGGTSPNGHSVPEEESLRSGPYTVSLSTTKLKTHRPQVSFDAFNKARFTNSLVPWDEDEVVGPDVTNRETLLELAKMSSNSYYEVPGTAGWYELGSKWNNSYPFGWDPDTDGFRGQIFVSSDNKTVVVSMKGTTAPYVGGGGPTTHKDKLNDNLLFSCCCAKVGFTWTAVCDCYKGGWKCNHDCLEDSLMEDSLFYPIGTNLYNNVSYIYPDANIWLTGHSLGGAIASLVGVTFGAPVVAFEAPGEKMASRRLHLPSPPSTQHITHVYHTADPIPMGVCNGVFSLCAVAGFAFESRCHLGNSVIYDTVTKLGWSVSLTSHPILVVIDQVLNITDWEVPVAAPEDVDCVAECYSWEFGDF